MDHSEQLASEMGIRAAQAEAVVRLLDEGATIPFLARYRKEAHGGLDEVAITALRDRLEQLRDLDARREAVVKSLADRDLLSVELAGKIAAAAGMSELEDLYLPYRPKRRTRATIAREKGLEPLADILLAQNSGTSPEKEAAAFVSAEKGVENAEAALAGTRDIIAEKAGEDAAARAALRDFFQRKALISSILVKGKEVEGAKFRDYFAWQEPASRAAGHRILAMLRGEKEGVLSLHFLPGTAEGKAVPVPTGERRAPAEKNLRGAVPSAREEEGAGLAKALADAGLGSKFSSSAPRRDSAPALSASPSSSDAEAALALLRRFFVRNASPAAVQVREAVDDGYKRLLAPSLETELRGALRRKAEEEAITVFARNLRELLLASPLGQKRVLAIDPGFRSGCKLVALDAQGGLLHHDLIHIMSPGQQREAGEKARRLVEKYALEAVAVGNGTAGRETEALIRDLKLPVPVFMVSESGASVYSASETARKEFPDLDLTVRGAVSIGRRLMDPLAELVKIDPKAIGVGQYQHDVDQGRLRQSLDDTVLSCVNAVGVELNTASPELLARVSGLGPALASSIVSHREANGPFVRRGDLRKVPRLGPKAFEQAAGFLRIRGGENPLDASAVHPESYGVVERMAKDLQCSVADLLDKPDLRRKIRPEDYVGEKAGLPTIMDILAELEKPGRDPRPEFEAFSFKEGVNSIDQLEVGMRLPGIVTNVTNFGAFVDIGVHQDGLIHISRMADHYVKDPNTVVSVRQKVSVTVLEVDKARKRITLSMKA